MCLSVGCGIYKVNYCKYCIVLYCIVLYRLDLIVKLNAFYSSPSLLSNLLIGQFVGLYARIT